MNENIIEGSIAVGCDASLDKQFAGWAHDHDRHVRFHDTKILSTLPTLLDWLIGEASEMQFHTDNINRDDGLILSRLLPQGAQEALL